MRKLWIILVALLLVIPAGARSKKAKDAEGKRDKQTDVAKKSGKLDVNTASESELEAVNGIGPVTAKKIIDNRPYRSINDLEKAGLSKSKIDDLRSSLKASRSSAKDESKAVDKPESDAAATAPSRSDQARSDQARSDQDSAQSANKNDDSKKLSLWDRIRGKKAEDAAQSQASTTRGASSNTAGVQNAPAPGGGDGKVWVNTDTKVYHREGDQWYGKTKHGEYMTERDAVAQGYRPVKERKKQ